MKKMIENVSRVLNLYMRELVKLGLNQQKRSKESQLFWTCGFDFIWAEKTWFSRPGQR
jgi:hypothetical protein